MRALHSHDLPLMVATQIAVADTALSMNNKANFLYNNVRQQVPEVSEDARKLYEKSLNIRERLLGKHPDTAQSYNNLGNLLLYQSDPQYVEAERYLKKALALRLELLGAFSLLTAATYNNLGNLYREQVRRTLGVGRCGSGKSHVAAVLTWRCLSSGQLRAR